MFFNEISSEKINGYNTLFVILVTHCNFRIQNLWAFSQKLFQFTQLLSVLIINNAKFYIYLIIYYISIIINVEIYDIINELVTTLPLWSYAVDNTQEVL